jgi:hypothetical protein
MVVRKLVCKAYSISYKSYYRSNADQTKQRRLNLVLEGTTDLFVGTNLVLVMKYATFNEIEFMKNS